MATAIQKPTIAGDRERRRESGPSESSHYAGVLRAVAAIGGADRRRRHQLVLDGVLVLQVRGNVHPQRRAAA